MLSKEQIQNSVATIKGLTDVERIKAAAKYGQDNKCFEIMSAALDRISEVAKRSVQSRDLTPLVNVELLKGFATTFKNGNTGFDANGVITVDGVEYRGEIRFARSGMKLTRYENGQRIRYNVEGKVLSSTKPVAKGKPSTDLAF